MNSLDTTCQTLGFNLTLSQLTTLNNYLALLLQWNKVMNLVGPYSAAEIIQNLFIDSFYLSRFITQLTTPTQTWDLGAGAGLPGIPLRALWQQGEYWLVEAREKRALFLTTCLAKHPLPDTKVFRGRVENFMPKQTPADLILSRAFMPWPALLSLVQPYLKPAGTIILLLPTPLTEVPAPWVITQNFTYPVKNTTRAFTAIQSI